MRKLCAHFGSGRKNIDECIIHYRPRHQTITRLDLVPVRTTMSYYGPAGSGGGGGGGRSGRSRGMQPPHRHGGGRSRGPPSHSRGRWGGGGNMRNRGGNAGRRRNQGPPQVSAKKLLKQLRALCEKPNPVSVIAAATRRLMDATGGQQPEGEAWRVVLLSLVRGREGTLEATALLDRQRQMIGLQRAADQVPVVLPGMGAAGEEDEKKSEEDVSAAAASGRGGGRFDGLLGAADATATDVTLAKVRSARHPDHLAHGAAKEEGRYRPLPVAALVAVLVALPQTGDVGADIGAGFIDAATPLLFMGGKSSAVSGAMRVQTPTLQQEARTYLQRRFRWAVLELLDEAKQAMARAYGTLDGSKTPPEALARMGRCVHGAVCQPGNKPGEVLFAGGNRGGEDVKRTMQPGDVVAISRITADEDGRVNDRMVEGEVKMAAPLIVKPICSDQDNSRYLTDQTPVSGVTPQWRVDKLANRVQFERALHGLRLIASAAAADDTEKAAVVAGGISGKNQTSQKEKRMRWPAPEIARAIVTADLDAEARGVEVTDNGSNRASSFAASPLTAPQSRSHFLSSRMGDLNNSQKEAFDTASSRRLTLIQGPPGTGKTQVSVKLLAEWARSGGPSELQGTDSSTGTQYGPGQAGFSRGGKKCLGPTVLACSDSNIAVDNLLDGLLRANVRAVRVGRPEATSPGLLPYCVDAIAAEAASRAKTMGQDPSSAARSARKRAMSGATVLCATCVGAGSAMLDEYNFTRVLIDEAAQATELASVVALTRGCKQLALVGDHCQLPPTVGSDLAKNDGLGSSMFGRLADAGVPTTLLGTQYRMHPAISAFPSACFYDSRIKDGIGPNSRPPVSGFEWPRRDFPVAFVPTGPGAIESGDGGTSKSNQYEANIVAGIIQGVLGGDPWGGSQPLRPEEIGVVTPYAAQVRLLRRQRPHQAIEVASVDGFQGREKELIIISTVRANRYGNVGFTADWRRANVALTRAKRGVIVVGNYETLIRERRSWAPLIKYLEANGAIVGQPRLSHSELPKLEDALSIAGKICKSIQSGGRTEHANTDASRKRDRASTSPPNKLEALEEQRWKERKVASQSERGYIID